MLLTTSDPCLFPLTLKVVFNVADELPEGDKGDADSVNAEDEPMSEDICSPFGESGDLD